MAPQLIDPFGRTIEYVRVSVTDRCDLRCQYCLPEGHQAFEEPAHWLTFDEIERVVRAFTELGVRRVRLTGGEPLTRHGLSELAARLHALPGLDDLSLSTNGVQLQRHARALKAAGVSRLNVSLDSLKPARFRDITGGGKLQKVLAGLTAAKDAGFQPIKINMVAMKGVNDDEIVDMVNFCISHGFILRLIETMPMGTTGRKVATDHYLDLQQVREDLTQRFDLVPALSTGGGPARYSEVRGSNVSIGFITPISQHFCATCNRVRLGVDGTLYLCLGQNNNFALRPFLGEGVSPGTLQQAIRNAIATKPERHEFREQPTNVIRFMSMTGG